MTFPNEHLSYYLDTLGIVVCYYPLLEEGRTDDRHFREANQEMFCRSLRFGTFGPPSDRASAYLMSTLGVAEIGDTAQGINFAASHPLLHGEAKHFFRTKETFWGPTVHHAIMGDCWYPNNSEEDEDAPLLAVFRVSLGVSGLDDEDMRDRCLAFGRAALDRYLAFLYLHQESDAWSHGEAFGLWLGRIKGRAEMREHAAEVAERCSGGDAKLSPRDLIAANIRALEVWQ